MARPRSDINYYQLLMFLFNELSRTPMRPPCTRLERWSIFDSDAMPMFFYVTAMRCRWFLDILTIAIGTIIFVQPSVPIVFRCFFQFKDRCLAMIFCGKTQKQRILRHAQIRDILCVY